MPSTSGVKASCVAEIPRRCLVCTSFPSRTVDQTLFGEQTPRISLLSLYTPQRWLYFWCDSLWWKEVHLWSSGFSQSIVEIITLLRQMVFRAHKERKRDGNPNITEVQFSFSVRFWAHWCQINVAKVYLLRPLSALLILLQSFPNWNGSR